MSEQKTQHKPSPNEAAAGLALATHISQSLSPKAPMQAQDAPQTPQDAPGQAEPQQEAQTPDNSQNDAKFVEMEGKMDQMKSEIEAMVHKEVSSVKDIIIEALNKEDGQ